MAETNRQPTIQYENVEVRYTELVHGLRGVTLNIDRGEFVFFVGKTGAGKSTLIKLLTREVRHDSGKVLLNGQDLGRLRSREIPALRRGMGIVPQDFALLPRKKVWENVAYAMRAVGQTRREVRERVPMLLERVSIAHRLDAYPHELSGGEQQRVAIARALINDPPLLIADEPTGNLDPDHSWEIMELLRSLNSKGTTVLVASHDMVTVERMACRTIRIEAGLIVSDSGAPTAVAEPDEQPATPESEPVAPEPESESELSPIPEPDLPNPRAAKPKEASTNG